MFRYVLGIALIGAFVLLLPTGSAFAAVHRDGERIDRRLDRRGERLHRRIDRRQRRR